MKNNEDIQKNEAMIDEHLLRVKDTVSLQLAESSAFAKTILALCIAVISASALAFKIVEAPSAKQYLYVIKSSYGLLISSILFAIITILYILSRTSSFLINLPDQKDKKAILQATKNLISSIRWLNIFTSLLFVTGLLCFALYILLANNLM